MSQLQTYLTDEWSLPQSSPFSDGRFIFVYEKKQNHQENAAASWVNYLAQSNSYRFENALKALMPEPWKYLVPLKKTDAANSLSNVLLFANKAFS